MINYCFFVFIDNVYGFVRYDVGVCEVFDRVDFQSVELIDGYIDLLVFVVDMIFEMDGNVWMVG